MTADGKLHTEQVAHCAHCSATWSVETDPTKGIRCMRCSDYVCRGHASVLEIRSNSLGGHVALARLCKRCSERVATQTNRQDYEPLMLLLIKLMSRRKVVKDD